MAAACQHTSHGGPGHIPDHVPVTIARFLNALIIGLFPGANGKADRKANEGGIAICPVMFLCCRR